MYYFWKEEITKEILKFYLLYWTHINVHTECKPIRSLSCNHFLLLENLIYVTIEYPYVVSLFCFYNMYTVIKKSRSREDTHTQCVNHLCLLVYIIFWLLLAELGAVTIWVPCVYFSLRSVKEAQPSFIGRHHRHVSFKSRLLTRVSVFKFVSFWPSVHI